MHQTQFPVIKYGRCLKRVIITLMIFLLLLSSSCVNLNFINNYASSSLQSLQKFETIDYSFKQNCLDKCRDSNIANLILEAAPCSCKSEEKADSVTLLIYNALKGYLDGLSNLSDNKLTCYKVNNLSKSLSEGEFGSLKIEKEQAEAFANIAKILAKAFTDEYRKHKIKEYVRAANTSVQVLTQCLSVNLASSLNGKLDIQKQRYESYYFDLIRDNSLSAYEKQKAVMDYYSLVQGLETKQKSIKTYARLLKKIGEGHQYLNDSLDKKSQKEIREVLSQYASDISDLVTEFNKLK